MSRESQDVGSIEEVAQTKTMTGLEFDINKEKYVNDMFLRCPGRHLIYVRTLKCASTYYTNLFKSQGWQLCKFVDIDWEQDHLFGLLMDPYRRHIKGLVEDMIILGVEKTLIQNINQNFWRVAPTLGIHSMGIAQMYKGFCHKINWIPMDVNRIDAKKILEDLFEKFNIEMQWTNTRDNESDDYQKELFNQIYKLFCGPGQSWYDITQGEDVALYNSAISNYRSINI
jgi:hypothetical protein